jgi:hypothetical protein
MKPIYKGIAHRRYFIISYQFKIKDNVTMYSGSFVNINYHFPSSIHILNDILKIVETEHEVPNNEIEYHSITNVQEISYRDFKSFVNDNEVGYEVIE